MLIHGANTGCSDVIRFFSRFSSPEVVHLKFASGMVVRLSLNFGVNG